MASSASSSISQSSLETGSSQAISSGDSMVSMKTRDHNELYDHRLHPDFISKDSNTETAIRPTLNTLNTNVSIITTNNNITPEKITESSTTAAPQSPSLPPPRRYRRYSHQSYLNSPAGLQPHELSDPVVEAAEQAANQFNANTKISLPPNCIQTESAPQNLRSTTPNINSVPIIQGNPNLHNFSERPRRLSKAQSASEALYPGMNLKRKNTTSSVRSSFDVHSVANNTVAIGLSKTKSSEATGPQIGRKTTRGSYDSDDSQGSRSSQETEEDVCFPMEPQLHTRVNGIDFDELEEFAQQSRQLKEQYLASMGRTDEKDPKLMNHSSTSSGSLLSRTSSAALKYTPRISAHQPPSVSTSDIQTQPAEPPMVSFGGRNKIEGEDNETLNTKYFTSENVTDYSNNTFTIPNRFSFFCSDSEETIHATDIASLVTKDQSFFDLFRAGEPTWWLDCSCPTDDEMRCIAKAFGIHPLTAEDIRIQEAREKVELFKSYYFVCFHTFENDKESEDFLEPINVYLVVFRTGMLTFHFGPISHGASVRRRVRQLRDYVNVNSDWLCYALIDDITDSFAPVIQSIEYEADVIEDSVFMARDIDFSAMLQKIGESRRKTMTLMRLLSGKADVIKMFAKRCQEEANGIGPALTSDINIANLHAAGQEEAGYRTQPRGDIAMYLGDIQDHLLTMYQNLSAYEKIFSRSHTNYLAQLQVESFNSNNKVTEILGKATIIGTIFVPLNVITGLFGMNVKVPGQDSSIAWWFGILGVLIALATSCWVFAVFWIGRIQPPTTLNEASESGAASIIPSIFSKGRRSGNKLYQKPRPPIPAGSINSLPSRLSRYK